MSSRSRSNASPCAPASITLPRPVRLPHVPDEDGHARIVERPAVEAREWAAVPIHDRTEDLDDAHPPDPRQIEERAQRDAEPQTPDQHPRAGRSDAAPPSRPTQRLHPEPGQRALALRAVAVDEEHALEDQRCRGPWAFADLQHQFARRRGGAKGPGLHFGHARMRPRDGDASARAFPPRLRPLSGCVRRTLCATLPPFQPIGPAAFATPGSDRGAKGVRHDPVRRCSSGPRQSLLP